MAEREKICLNSIKIFNQKFYNCQEKYFKNFKRTAQTKLKISVYCLRAKRLSKEESLAQRLYFILPSANRNSGL